MNTLLKDVFDSLHQNSIAYCILRDGADLATADLRDAEIDLLVNAQQYHQFDVLMRGMGFRPFSRLGYEPHKHYVRQLENENSKFELDVVTHINYGKGMLDLNTDLAENCLQNRRLLDGFYVPGVEDELFIVMLHCLLDKNRIEPHRAARIQALREQVTNPAYLSTLCTRYWSAKTTWSDIDALIARGQWADLLAQREAVAAHIMKQDLIGSWTRAVGKRTLRKVDRFVRMTRRTLPFRA